MGDTNPICILCIPPPRWILAISALPRFHIHLSFSSVPLSIHLPLPHRLDHPGEPPLFKIKLPKLQVSTVRHLCQTARKNTRTQ